ncbi:unnamed protein product [Zymoseptoria tritici ST99CH_1A5]|uniref:FAD-binding FR-type domain-containing protein n=1 Tax=Zymoseptoria tritici ST99CH_1A5 TaxID=1276529 RepID=A0A1Y6L3D6_ZYMTR|nr:unnamed protein product [Zymoseptoria tritici ST99CH_1A5]
MSHSSGEASPAVQAAEHAREVLFAEWQIKDENTAKFFGFAMAGLVAVFTITHQVDVLFTKEFARSSGSSTVARSMRRTLQLFSRSKIVAGVVLLPGKIVLALLYFGINAGLTFHDRPDRVGFNVLAKRFGWLALCNLCLVMFLGLKNTPLSPLAGRSFDQVNVLHRFCGYTTVALSIIHSVMYVDGLSKYGVLEQILQEPAQYAGIVAGLSMLMIAVTAVGFVRRRQYEVFYAAHIVLVAIVLVAVGLHRPEIGLKALIITIVAAAMWFIDKSLRLSRWLYYGVGNYCTLTPLPGRATRITMHRSMRAQPGSMAFVWIPGVRMFQRHPFTLVSTEPAEFVVQARDGFTKELYHTACRNPGVKFRAALEGPYGVVPNTHEFDKIVLVAGGSGATFTLALALDWARRRRTPKDLSSLDFIWTVRDKTSLDWLETEIAELHTRSRVNVFLHVSGNGERDRGSSSNEVDPRFIIEDEKIERSKTIDAEKSTIRHTKNSKSTSSSITISYDIGRPNLASAVRMAMFGLKAEDRVLVAGCGPEALLRDTSKAADDCRVTGAPSITTYLEHYSL